MNNELGAFSMTKSNEGNSVGAPADGGVRARFEASFLDYFGRGPNSAQFDKLGQFWLDRLEDGRYEMTRVDDAWTGWLACERANAQLHNVSKLGHEQMFAEAQAANQLVAELLAALKDMLRIATAASIGVSGSQPRLDRARAAILKATTKPPEQG